MDGPARQIKPEVLVEGDLDGVLFEDLFRRTALQQYQVKKTGGKDNIDLLLDVVERGEPEVFVCWDLDGNSEEGLLDDLVSKLRSQAKSRNLALTACTIDRLKAEVNGCSVRLVPVGLPRDSELRKLGVISFGGDDYVLRLLLEKSVFDAFVSGEGLKTLPHEKAIAKHKATADRLSEQLKQNGLVPLESGKRHLELLKAVIGFRASPATLACRVLSSTPEENWGSVVGPLVKFFR